MVWAIEDWVRPEDGDPVDPKFDWLPVFKRAQESFFDTAAKDFSRFRVYPVPVMVGLKQAVYRLSGTLDLFGFWLKSVRGNATLQFTGMGDGLVLHFPRSSAGEGTHSSGYGGGSYFEGPLRIVGHGAPGSVGLRAHIGFEASGVSCEGWGLHGFLIDADAHRTLHSNASRWWMHRCGALNNGFGSPSIAYGSGLMVQGGDSQVGLSTQFTAIGNAGWGIFDSSFLGNTHISPHARGNGRVVHANDAEATLFGVKEGVLFPLAYRSDGGSERTLFVNPYVEGSAIVDVPPPSMVIGGIGGAYQPSTKRILAGRLEGVWSTG